MRNRLYSRRKSATVAGHIAATESAITAVVMAAKATMATVPTPARMAAKAGPSRTATLRTGRRRRRGSQAASKMLHLCSARASRAAKPATAGPTEAIGDNWMAKEELLEFDGTV